VERGTHGPWYLERRETEPSPFKKNAKEKRRKERMNLVIAKRTDLERSGWQINEAENVKKINE
jgi:hypothetical protein